MPKQKTVSSARKRFKVSGAGKLLRRHAMRSHKLEKKSAKRKRGFRRANPVSEAQTRTVEKQLGL